MKLLGLILAYLALAPLFAWVDKLLINYIFSPQTLQVVFGVPQVGFWRAWAIVMLTGFVVGKFSTSSGKD